MIVRKLEGENLPLKDAFVLKPQEFRDERGTFYKLYTEAVLKEFGMEPYFPEEYLTVSKKGVLRGLHYQSGKYAQGKLVRCLNGEIYDVILDLRKGSPTFGKWTGIVLSARNMLSLFVPRGFAHGFVSLTEDAALLYRVDNGYSPDNERGVLWNDPQLGINWNVTNPTLSEKDKKWPLFKDADYFE